MNRLALSALVAALLGAAACGGETPEPPSRRHVVEIRGFEYHPATLAVAEGDTVVWLNRDAVPHTVTALDGTWDSGSIEANGSWSLVVEATGDGEYICTFHPTMIGQVTVEGSVGSTGESES